MNIKRRTQEFVMKNSIIIPKLLKSDSLKRSFSFSEENSDILKTRQEPLNLPPLNPMQNTDELATPTFVGLHSSEIRNNKESQKLDLSKIQGEELSFIENSVDEHNYPKFSSSKVKFFAYNKPKDQVLTKYKNEEFSKEIDFFSLSHEEEEHKRVCNVRNINCGCELF